MAGTREELLLLVGEQQTQRLIAFFAILHLVSGGPYMHVQFQYQDFYSLVLIQ